MIEYELGNVFIRQGGPMAKGEVVETHKHNFDHVTFISKGAALIERLDGDDEAPGPNILQSVEKRASEGKNWVLVLKDNWHRLTSLEDGTIYQCIYAHRTPQGDVVQQYDGWDKGNT